MDWLISLWLLSSWVPLAFFFAACPCCPVSCDIFADNFNRASLGSDWSVEAGTATIASNQLDPSTDALVIMTNAHPSSSPTGKWEIELFSLSNGDKIRSVFGYVDNDNYFFGELVYNSSGNWNITIYERASGSNSAVSVTVSSNAFAPSTPTILTVCSYGSWASFRARTSSNDGLAAIADGVSITGDQVGLATGDALGSGFRFDNANWDHNEGTVSTCPCAQCTCDSCTNPNAGGSPCEVQVESSGVNNGTCSDCGDYNNVIIYPFSEYSAGGGNCGWLLYTSQCTTHSPLAFNYFFSISTYVLNYTVKSSLGGRQVVSTQNVSQQNCLTWNPVTFNVSSSGFNDVCDWRSSTILVSTLIPS